MRDLLNKPAIIIASELRQMDSSDDGVVDMFRFKSEFLSKEYPASGARMRRSTQALSSRDFRVCPGHETPLPACHTRHSRVRGTAGEIRRMVNETSSYLFNIKMAGS